MSDNICKNCDLVIEQNFCANCGQKKYKRIDRKYLIDEVQYVAIHTNKGFFYSIKNILKNPGKTARDFVDGNRVNHYKPIGLAFILSGFSTFISFKFLNFKEMLAKSYTQMGIPEHTANPILTWITSYMSLFSLALLPIFAIFTYIVFKKWGQNFFEHIVMNAFFQCYYTLITILLIYPLLYFSKDNISLFLNITLVSTLIVPLLLMWFYKGFYPEKSWLGIVGKVILFFVLFILSYFIFALCLGIISRLF